MLLNIKLNDEALSILDKIFSCIICTEKEEQGFSEEQAHEVFLELENIIMEEELPGEYFVIFKMLKNINRLKLRREQFPFKLNEKLFTDNLTVSLNRLLTVYQDNIIDIVERMGGNTDLTIPLNFQQACNTVFAMCVEKFKDLCQIDNKTEDGLQYVQQFIEKIKEILMQTVIITQSEIMINGVKIGRKHYMGAQGAKEFIEIIPSILQERFKDISIMEDTTSFVSMDGTLQFEKENKLAVRKLFTFNIEPLDKICYIRTGDIVTLVGNEGVGKTNMGVMLAMNAIHAGYDALYMAGESPVTKIYNMCISNHIFRKFGYRITWQELLDKEFCMSLPLEVQKAIYFAKKDLVENPKYGKLHIRPRFAYETFYPTMQAFYQKHPNLGVVIIDHTDKLITKGILTVNGYLNDQKKRVDFLFDAEVMCKNNFPFAMINLAHTGSETAKDIQRGKATGVRVGSSSGATTKDADMVIILKKEDADFVRVEVPKMRDFKDLTSVFLLKKDFSASNFIYSSEFQYKVDIDEDIDEQIE